MTKNVSIFAPVPGTELTFTLTNATAVSGWQKVAQMFLSLFFTQRGSIPSEPTAGTTFLDEVWTGLIRSDEMLKSSFEFAVQDVLSYLNSIGYNNRVPAEEQLRNVILDRFVFSQTSMQLWVRFVTASGEIGLQWVPVPLTEAE